MRTLIAIALTILLLILIVLWVRWNRCSKTGSSVKCSFWTGKPISGAEVAPAAGQVDLWCEEGKYYKRTTTGVYGVVDRVEITRPEFDALVAQGTPYSGCKVGDGGVITA